MSWSIKDIPDLKGKRFIVTGGNTGIGLATVRALAGRGGHVVLACRNVEKGRAAHAAVVAENPSIVIDVEPLDLASLASVKAFADKALARMPTLNVLINNAGVATPPFGRTADGFETQFGTNVLGHFALTGRLLPLLEATPGARVVSLSSLAHWFGKIDFDNLNAERGYSATGAYYQSKLANLMLAYELQRRLVRKGSSTVSLAVHPGVTRSELFRHSRVLERGTGIFAQSAEDGALPTLMAATAVNQRGGDYLGPGGLLGIKGPPGLQKSSKLSDDESIASRLWQRVQELTGVEYL